MEKKERHPVLRLLQGFAKHPFGKDRFMWKNEVGYLASNTVSTRVGSPVNLSVGVLIPARNEEKNIEDVIYRLKSLGYENVLVIDGGSEDATVETAKKKRG